MKKKFLISTALLIAVLAVFTSYSFATSNMLNTLEHGAQNVASDVGTVVTRGVDATKNTVENAGNAVAGATTTKNATNNTVAGTTGTKTGTTTNNYTATKTNTGTVKVAGMTATAWAWLIVGILGVAIVALVWFYGKQHSDYTSTNHNSNNE
ncbi:MAG: hypothetical protein ACI4VQ_06445, partial [Clostridia bacterium]